MRIHFFFVLPNIDRSISVSLLLYIWNAFVVVCLPIHVLSSLLVEKRIMWGWLSFFQSFEFFLIYSLLFHLFLFVKKKKKFNLAGFPNFSLPFFLKYEIKLIFVEKLIFRQSLSFVAFVSTQIFDTIHSLLASDWTTRRRRLANLPIWLKCVDNLFQFCFEFSLRFRDYFFLLLEYINIFSTNRSHCIAFLKKARTLILMSFNWCGCVS